MSTWAKICLKAFLTALVLMLGPSFATFVLYGFDAGMNGNHGPYGPVGFPFFILIWSLSTAIAFIPAFAYFSPFQRGTKISILVWSGTAIAAFVILGSVVMDQQL